MGKLGGCFGMLGDAWGFSNDVQGHRDQSNNNKMDGLRVGVCQCVSVCVGCLGV